MVETAKAAAVMLAGLLLIVGVAAVADALNGPDPDTSDVVTVF